MGRIGLCAAAFLAITGVAGALPPGDRVTVEGLGAVKIGMTVRQVERVAGHKLNLDYSVGGGACGTGQLAPKVSVLFTGTRLARIYVRTRRHATGAGVRIGASTRRVLRVYGARIRREPHFYTDGEYLKLTSGNRRLVFETDGHGTVVSISTGHTPAIDFVEGCA